MLSADLLRTAFQRVGQEQCELTFQSVHALKFRTSEGRSSFENDGAPR